jgi:hypothetical protein
MMQVKPTSIIPFLLGMMQVKPTKFVNKIIEANWPISGDRKIKIKD